MEIYVFCRVWPSMSLGRISLHLKCPHSTLELPSFNFITTTMSSLMEPPSPPSSSKPLPQQSSRPSPIQTFHLTRPIAGISTDLIIQSFDDRILVIITQNQKIGILVSPISLESSQYPSKGGEPASYPMLTPRPKHQSPK
jgi:hypothetical protein